MAQPHLTGVASSLMVVSTAAAVVMAIPVTTMGPVMAVTLAVPPPPVVEEERRDAGSLFRPAKGCSIHPPGRSWRGLEEPRSGRR